LVAQFEIYKDNAGKYRWRLRSSGNYKIIADSGEGYETKAACEQGVHLVKQEAPTATIQYL
jgi:hypothetical protein